MDFKSALNKICNDFNKDIIFERRVISILDDYGAFNDVPYYKLFYKTVLLSGSLIKLLSLNDNDRDNELFIFISKTGLDERKVKDFLSEIASCYCSTSNVPEKSCDTIITAKIPKRISDKTAQRQSEDTSNKIDYISDLCLFDIPLGSSLETFEKGLIKRGYKKNKSNTSDYEEYWDFFGKFAGMDSCHIRLFYFQSNRIIYKIEIFKDTTFAYGGYAAVHEHIMSLYREKYGSCKLMSKNVNVGGINRIDQFQYSTNGIIKISTGTFWGNSITYIDTYLEGLASPEIKKRRKDATNAKIARDKSIRDKNLNDI